LRIAPETTLMPVVYVLVPADALSGRISDAAKVTRKKNAKWWLRRRIIVVMVRHFLKVT
jgi:hypothetical protein